MTYASRTSLDFGRLLAQPSSGNGTSLCSDFGIVRILVVRFLDVDYSNVAVHTLKNTDDVRIDFSGGEGRRDTVPENQTFWKPNCYREC